MMTSRKKKGIRDIAVAPSTPQPSITPVSDYALGMAGRTWSAIGMSKRTAVEVIAAHIQMAMDAVALEAKLEASAKKQG